MTVENNRQGAAYSVTDGGQSPKGETLRVGLVTTWNQHCGLATYARFMVEQFAGVDLTIFAEQVEQLTAPDEPFVTRCWRRVSSGQTSEGAASHSCRALRNAVESRELDILHLNIHPSFFRFPEFAELLDSVRAKGIKIVVQVHNLFTNELPLREVLSRADSVFVHMPENRLEAIALGALPAAVRVITHGVQVRKERSGETRDVLRRQLALPLDKKIICSFGFIQPHKGMEAVLEGVVHLKTLGIPVFGLIVGASRDDDPNSRAYLEALRNLVRVHGLEQDVRFVSEFITDDKVGDYLTASDLVVMNYRSQHYEASGACSLAIGTGSVIMASTAPAMLAFGDAVWHLTSGYPAGLSAALILTNDKLIAELRKGAAEYCERNSWQKVGLRIVQEYRKMCPQQVSEEVAVEKVELKERPVTNSNVSNPNTSLRVLIQNRPHTFERRGGDTVVIERLRDGLQSRGCNVVVDTSGNQDPAKFDLVHIFNFATPDLTKAFAEGAHRAGTPFVVTTLYEDLPSFHNQSHAIANHLVEYVSRGQSRTWWSSEELDLHRIPPSDKFDNTWTAKNAAALFPNGLREAAALRRDYGDLKTLVEVKLGHEVGTLTPASMFENQYGVRDFILCVGRFESRKNQLMLLKALEDSDITVVLASGGFSYQPEYDSAVRNFKRRGNTIILDRVSPEMLSSAYSACRVHVLPSWYELPGLVSLEAAAHGKNVVVTRLGTASDYFGDKAFYCQPWDEDSVRNAAIAAYYAPVATGIVTLAKSFTWEAAVDSTLKAYRAIMPAQTQTVTSAGATPAAPPSNAGWYDMSSDATDFQDSLERGELAAKNMEFPLAHELLAKAEQLDPKSVRTLKARGAVFLAESNVAEAVKYFDRALGFAPCDPKVLSGRGMCEMIERRPDQAIPFFRKALEIAPDHLVALHQMVDCAYRLNSFDELNQVLQRYLAMKPDDVEMRFCFAGCLYKQNDLSQARAQITTVLASKPEHRGATELLEKINSSREVETSAVAAQQTPKPLAIKSLAVQAAPTAEVVAAPGSAVAPSATKESLENSITELAKRITQWKVGSTESVATAPAASVPVQAISDSEASARTTSPMPLPTTLAPAHPVPNSNPESFLKLDLTNQGAGTRSASGVNDLDVKFFEIEDAKRERNYELAKEKLDVLAKNALLTPEQRGRVDCIQAELMVVEGDLVGSDLLYDLVLKSLPEYARALCGKGALAAEDQRWSEARDYFNRATLSNPNFDVSWAGLALCEMVENNADQSFELFQKAIRLNPENSRAILGIIQLGYPLNRLSEVEQALTTFLDLHPVNIDMMYSLAGVLYAQNRVSEAKAEIEKILLFEPNNARAVELQSMIAERSANPTPFQAPNAFA